MAFDSPRSSRNSTFTCRLDCHYLLLEPEEPAADSLLIATLHGYGGNPEEMLRLTSAVVGPRHAIASIEGPHRFYLTDSFEEVGYGWGAHHTAPSIRLHHEMVLHVLNSAGRECGIGPERRVLAGYSQAVPLNYRFAAACPDAVRGVMAFCGGLPPEWAEGAAGRVKAAILHVARRSDEYFPRRVAQGFEEVLRRQASDVEFHMMEGPHRFPSKAGPVVARWLERLMGATRAAGKARGKSAHAAGSR